MADAVYSPEPLENKPEWFNGFIRLEKHHKEKYNWYRYVYIPDYYSENYCEDPDVFSESRFGHITPSKEGCEFIDKNFQDYYENSHIRYFNEDSKDEIGGKFLGNATLFNTATQQEEQHRYFFADGNYIIRQLTEYDKPQLKDMIKTCAEALGEYILIHHGAPLLEKGHIIAPFDKDRNMRGLLTLTVTDKYVAPEPIGYIDSDSQGKGIYGIYHDLTLGLGMATESEYVYAQSKVENEKMNEIYEALGYVKDKEIKLYGKKSQTAYYTFKYYFETKQQSFF